MPTNHTPVKKQEQVKMEDQLRSLVHQRGAVKGKLTRVNTALQTSASHGELYVTLKNLHYL